MIKILFICHGNICRSTMAQYVLQDMVNNQGIADRFYIDSAATSYEEIGNGVHPGTRNKLKSEGIPCGNHRARHIEKSDYNEFDYIIGMDSANIRNIGRIVGNDRDGKVYIHRRIRTGTERVRTGFERLHRRMRRNPYPK